MSFPALSPPRGIRCLAHAALLVAAWAPTYGSRAEAQSRRELLDAHRVFSAFARQAPVGVVDLARALARGSLPLPDGVKAYTATKHGNPYVYVALRPRASEELRDLYYDLSVAVPSHLTLVFDKQALDRATREAPPAAHAARTSERAGCLRAISEAVQDEDYPRIAALGARSHLLKRALDQPGDEVLPELAVGSWLDAAGKGFETVAVTNPAALARDGQGSLTRLLGASEADVGGGRPGVIGVLEGDLAPSLAVPFRAVEDNGLLTARLRLYSDGEPVAVRGIPRDDLHALSLRLLDLVPPFSENHLLRETSW